MRFSMRLATLVTAALLAATACNTGDDSNGTPDDGAPG